MKNAQELEQRWATNNAKEQARKILEAKILEMSCNFEEEVKKQKVEIDNLRTMVMKKEEEIQLYKTIVLEQENVIINMRRNDTNFEATQ